MLKFLSIRSRFSWAIACLAGMLSIPWIGGYLAGLQNSGMTNVFLRGTGSCGYSHAHLLIEKFEVSKGGNFWETVPLSPHARRVDLMDPVTSGISFLGQSALSSGRYRLLRLSLNVDGNAVELVGMKKLLPMQACENAQTTYYLPINWYIPAGVFSNFVLDVNVCHSILLYEAFPNQPLTACFDGFKVSN